MLHACILDNQLNTLSVHLVDVHLTLVEFLVLTCTLAMPRKPVYSSELLLVVGYGYQVAP